MAVSNSNVYNIKMNALLPGEKCTDHHVFSPFKNVTSLAGCLNFIDILPVVRVGDMIFKYYRQTMLFAFKDKNDELAGYDFMTDWVFEDEYRFKIMMHKHVGSKVIDEAYYLSGNEHFNYEWSSNNVPNDYFLVRYDDMYTPFGISDRKWNAGRGKTVLLKDKYVFFLGEVFVVFNLDFSLEAIFTIGVADFNTNFITYQSVVYGDSLFYLKANLVC